MGVSWRLRLRCLGGAKVSGEGQCFAQPTPLRAGRRKTKARQTAVGVVAWVRPRGLV